MILVTGGAASGKSALGERICCGFGNKLLYVATMEPHSPEAAARILRHRAARAGKGFTTLECSRDLHKVVLERGYDCALLECMGNLLAGQMFGAGTSSDRLVETVLAGVRRLSAQLPQLVIVTNQVFSGAEQYGGDMAVYLDCLGKINAQVASEATAVVESVCGLALPHKGGIAL